MAYEVRYYEGLKAVDDNGVVIRCQADPSGLVKIMYQISTPWIAWAAWRRR